MDGINFHITCPVNIFSVVTVEIVDNGSFFSCPKERTKAALALGRALAFLGKRDVGGKMTIRSPLPLGKGMASSTADVAGAIEAACYALGKTPASSLVAEIALSVEPTNGNFFPGVVAFDHREGKLIMPLGTPPPIDIIVLDCGGQVDTLSFNAQDWRSVRRRWEPQIREAFSAVKEGIFKGAPELIGAGATISARANQDILFKPQLDRVEVLSREAGAVGVNVGHSGTVIGILLDARKSDREAVANYLARRLEGIAPIVSGLFVCSLIGGGGRILESSAEQITAKAYT